jgi:hypothetical protein
MFLRRNHGRLGFFKRRLRREEKALAGHVIPIHPVDENKTKIMGVLLRTSCLQAAKFEA